MGKLLTSFFSSVSIVVNNSCNTKCVFCFFHSPGLNPPKPMGISFRFFKRIIDRLEEFHPNLKIHSDGEPLIYPKIWELIKYAKPRVKQIEILTNLRHKGVVNHLIGVDALLVNLPAPTKASYLLQRPGDTAGFEIVISNLKQIKKTRTLVILSLVLNKLNQTPKLLKQYVELASEMGAFKVKFTKMIGIKSTNYLLPSSPPSEKLRQELIQLGSQQGIKVEFDEFSEQSPKTECTMTSMINLDKSISYCCKLRGTNLKNLFVSNKLLENELRSMTKENEEKLCKDCPFKGL